MKFLILLPLYYTAACLTIPFVTALFIPHAKEISPPPQKNIENTITVFNHTDNTTYNINIEDYLIGVVAAEMPAAFEPEALKAQAVAARTYTMYKSASSDHDADICTDYTHCQAYLSEEEMHENWKNDYNFYFDKIKNAVYSTSGEYLSYNEEPIMAVFHSMGGGQTQNSADVWGTQMPYLVSVPSPGEEEATNYHSTLSVSFSEFKNTILKDYPNAKIASCLDVSKPTLTQSGHVKSILIGTVSIPGSKIRSMFNLRSTKFTLSFTDDTVTFSVTGYGHGVGMSQYGANAMAKTGKTYKEILSHYYQGVTFSE
ncbi:MAG: stage II sporulation protein D [Clostridia bacterium]|nr:stage II sporulation protein D [Clostridia bacterium]